MVRKVLSVKDPKLREISKPVTKIDKKILSLIGDLKDTLGAQKEPEGVGLAACQIGKNLRIFVINHRRKLKPLINPQIVAKKRKKKVKKGPKGPAIMEGCLSLPNYYGALRRADEVTIKYLNLEGKEKIETFSGLSAQIIQHEIDHLNGVIFIDRILEQKKTLFKLSGNEWQEVELV